MTPKMKFGRQIGLMGAAMILVVSAALASSGSPKQSSVPERAAPQNPSGTVADTAAPAVSDLTAALSTHRRAAALSAHRRPAAQKNSREGKKDDKKRAVGTVSAYSIFTEKAPPGRLSTACPGTYCGWYTASDTTLFIGPAIFATEDYTLYGFPDSSKPWVLNYHGTAVFHVTSSPCGTGDFTANITDGTADFTTINPSTQRVHVQNNWTIVSGSGTGELAGIEGSGTHALEDGSFTVAGLSGDPETNRGVMDGTLTCRLR